MNRPGCLKLDRCPLPRPDGSPQYMISWPVWADDVSKWVADRVRIPPLTDYPAIRLRYRNGDAYEWFAWIDAAEHQNLLEMPIADY